MFLLRTNTGYATISSFPRLLSFFPARKFMNRGSERVSERTPFLPYPSFLPPLGFRAAVTCPLHHHQRHAAAAAAVPYGWLLSWWCRSRGFLTPTKNLAEFRIGGKNESITESRSVALPPSFDYIGVLSRSPALEARPYDVCGQCCQTAAFEEDCGFLSFCLVPGHGIE